MIPSITLENIFLNIPVFLPGQQRMFKKPKLTKVGGNISGNSGKLCVEALKDITLNIKSGQHLALIGINGSGKSTMLRLLAGIYPPTQGTIKTIGTIGCLFEFGSGFTPDMTGIECIKYHFITKTGRLVGWKATAEDIAEFTELGDYLEMPIRTYSDGMRARLIASLATSWHTDIMLIDEGIGAGDASFHTKFQTRLDRFMDSAGLLVMASHSTDLLKKYCSIGLVLNRGTMQFIGPIDNALEFYGNNTQ